ncbi:gfo/Idh/MocA family oxidoreductase [Clostridiales bacterium COT073_COT-073]|nr:gfo/Idh/MocA family oxidoreductase [Clostridiales bacterium COT073_COT-073]
MNFAIVGCGVIAETHGKALKMLEAEGCKLYAVCDIVQEKAEKFAEKYGVGVIYYDDESVMQDSNIDVICVCVPSGTHGLICKMAAQAGKHIICEKPMEINEQKMAEITNVVEKSGIKMQCVFQRRLMPTAQAVKQLICENKLGKICLAEAQLKYYRDQAYYDSAGWRGTWKQDGGGALMNQGVHGVDLIFWMLDKEIDTLYGKAETLARKIEVEDTATALIQMKDRSLCVIQSATTAYPGFSTTFSVYGEKGTVIFNDSGILEWTFIDKENQPPRPEGNIEIGGSKSNIDITIDGHIILLRDLKEAIIQNRAPMIPPQDAQLAVKVICSIYQSSKTGKVIQF